MLYGTPVPGYAAPQETVEVAARIAAVFVDVAPSGVSLTGGNSNLGRQLGSAAGDFGVAPGVLGWVLAALAQLIGLLTLEFGGHFVGTADPADHLWDAVVLGQQAAAV